MSCVRYASQMGSITQLDCGFCVRFDVLCESPLSRRDLISFLSAQDRASTIYILGVLAEDVPSCLARGQGRDGSHAVPSPPRVPTAYHVVLRQSLHLSMQVQRPDNISLLRGPRASVMYCCTRKGNEVLSLQLCLEIAPLRKT